MATTLAGACRATPNARLNHVSARRRIVPAARPIGFVEAGEDDETDIEAWSKKICDPKGHGQPQCDFDDMLRGIGTRSVHGGQRGGQPRVIDSITTPIIQSSTFAYRNTAELIAYKEGRYGHYEYGRYGNPTARAVEEKICSLENTEDCIVSSSGMNAATTMLLGLVPVGGHIVTTTDCYKQTRKFMETFLPKLSIGITIIDPSDYNALEAALEEHDVTIYFSESPTNPGLRCVDIERVSRLCHAKGAIVAIDSTFASPVNLRPAEFGADLVVHSATKYFGGHNDVLAGAVAGKAELVQQVRLMHNVLGGTLDPHAAWLVLRGMKTLELRIERTNDTALEIARRLEGHPDIERVFYPGLESHPDYEVAQAQMTGFGGVVSFLVKGDVWRTARFIDGLKIPYMAPSLGGVESIILQPAVMTFWDMSPEERAAIGIQDNLIRFSVGIENVEDIWDDLVQALARLEGH